MSKYYRNRCLQVKCRPDGGPSEILHMERFQSIEAILEYWLDTGCWWEGESEKAFFRLLLSGGGIMEIFRDLDSGEWYLYKSYD